MYSLTDYCAILFQVAAFKKKFAGVWCMVTTLEDFSQEADKYYKVCH